MQVTPIKTTIISRHDSIERLIDTYISGISDNSILVISSKILAIMQDDVVDITKDKQSLIQQECEYYLPNEYNKFGANITITGNKLVSAAGIDESNVDNMYVLLPSHVQQSANRIRQYCIQTFNCKNIGVLITDSRSLPLHIGTYSDAIAYSGISAVRDYRGTVDLFGREFKAERQNLIISFATVANIGMGEGSESCPIALITNVTSDVFVEDNPTKEELDTYFYDKKDDVFAALLDSEIWQKGGGSFLKRQEV